MRTYLSGFIEKDVVKIIEKDENNKRHFREDNIEFVFYTLDQYGAHKTIFGENCTRHVFKRRSEFYQARKQYPSDIVYEDDVNPLFRFLSKNYSFDDVPPLNVAFYDIEVAYNKKNKYSNPERADNEVISVAVYQSWSKMMYMLIMPPETLTLKDCEERCERIEKEYDNVRCLVVDNEGDLLKAFLMLIEDSDVISGWNSKMYDFKYLSNRIPKIIGPQYLKGLCLLGKDPVEKSKYNAKFRREEFYYDCIGRVHLDYMELYKKYTYNELSSYSLDHVSLVELEEQKLQYDHSLDHLYKFDFDNFVRYNIKDTYLVKRIDDKLKFIELTNLLAHNNGVLLETTMGTVALTEQAILNEGHYYGDEVLVFPSKSPPDENESGAAGAFVSPPQVGIRKMVAGSDINSLYPSVLRSLNMSTETLIAQVDTTRTEEHILEMVASGKAESAAEAWRSFFNTYEFDDVMGRSDKVIPLTFNRTGEVMEITGAQIHDLVFKDRKYAISANGTIFSLEKMGVIPRLLTRWYSERKEMQAKAEHWVKLVADETDPVKKEEYERNHKFWDQRQMAKKINLNALYGALLNKHCRFYDKRLGQSTTLTGRSITKHMSSKINELIDGDYNHMGPAITYGDSVTGDTIVTTNMGDMTIEEAFNSCTKYWNEPNTNKEYAHRDDLKILTFDPDKNETYYGDINYVYRHKTSKSKWRVTDSEGNKVVVTGDHSVMIEREGILIKIKPKDMALGDTTITSSTARTTVTSIEQLEDFDDENVYDVGMKNEKHNWFFGNSLLLKNTDSVASDTKIRTNMGEVTVAELYHLCSVKWDSRDKEYSADDRVKVLSYDPAAGTVFYKKFDYVYRHRTNKQLWRITDSSGTHVDTTNDHSVMIERNGCMVEVKPYRIVVGDILIKNIKHIRDKVTRVAVASVEKLRTSDDEYVYDIGIDKDTPYFFGNDILVHNSSYFSVYESYKQSGDKEKEQLAEMLLKDKDLAIAIYNDISYKTNLTFPEFMDRQFNTGIENGSIIQAARENLADYSLFIKRKRYAMNLIDKDGIRQDTNGKNGKMKVMGIEIKRSDTPKIIQVELETGLKMLLSGKNEDAVLQHFIDYKEKFLEKSPWVVGRPSGANAVRYYSALYREYTEGTGDKVMVPAAIMGAIAWNELLDIHNEDHLERISDGSKVIVCPLKNNDYGYTKISYPTDLTKFPEWFKALPFDRDEMIEKIFYKKVSNIFGVLDWDFGIIKANENFHKNFVLDDD